MIYEQDLRAYTDSTRILLRAREFICLLPHPGLRKYISNYNITFPTKDLMPDRFTEMPCGCGTLTIGNDDRKIAVHLDGPSTRPCLVGNHANQLKMIITIEFRPAGLYAITGIDQWELIDSSMSLDDVVPELSKALSEITEKTERVDELISGVDLLLLKHLSDAYPPQIIRTLGNIVGHAGTIDIRTLSDEIHYSERHLNRMFRQHVGISAKAFSRLIRLHHAFLLLKNEDHSLTFVSDVAGFHDLSHFSRDFRSVCGITPVEYRENMSDFYINSMKF